MDTAPVPSRAPGADPPPPRSRDEFIPALERADTFSDWLDHRDYAAAADHCAGTGASQSASGDAGGPSLRAAVRGPHASYTGGR